MLQCYNFKNQKQTNKLHLKNSLNTSIRLVFLDLLTFRVNSFCLELYSSTETSLVMGIEMKGMYEK